MEITVILYLALTAVFIEINAIICIPVVAENLTNPTTETKSDISTSSEPQQEIIPSIPDPLSPKLFPRSIRNILSPEVFSHADPIDYFISKTSHLPWGGYRKLMLEVDYFLTSRRSPPQPYAAYAEVLSEFLRCMDLLNNVQSAIKSMQSIEPGLRSISVADISSPDPELSMLFTPDIFADKNPPSVVLKKLLEIPNNEMRNVTIRLKDLVNTRKSNVITSMCHYYIKYLSRFFEQHGISTLRKIKLGISKIHKAIP